MAAHLHRRKHEHLAAGRVRCRAICRALRNIAPDYGGSAGLRIARILCNCDRYSRAPRIPVSDTDGYWLRSFSDDNRRGSGRQTTVHLDRFYALSTSGEVVTDTIRAWSVKAGSGSMPGAHEFRVDTKPGRPLPGNKCPDGPETTWCGVLLFRPRRASLASGARTSALTQASLRARAIDSGRRPGRRCVDRESMKRARKAKVFGSPSWVIVLQPRINDVEVAVGHGVLLYRLIVITFAGRTAAAISRGAAARAPPQYMTVGQNRLPVQGLAP